MDAFTEADARQHIMMNGVLVSIRDAVRNVQRFCRPLTLHNVGSSFDLTTRGSCFLLRHRQALFLLATRHQLGVRADAYHPSQICINTFKEVGTRTIGISPTEEIVVTLGGGIDDDLEDIIIAQFFPENYEHDPTDMFFVDNFMTDLDAIPDEQIITIFVLGYPSSQTDVDFVPNEDTGEEKVLVTHRWQRIFLEKKADASIGKNFCALKLHARYGDRAFDFDGFSGAPVFFLYRRPSQSIEMGFAGIVAMATVNQVNVIDGALIKRAIESKLTTNQMAPP